MRNLLRALFGRKPAAGSGAPTPVDGYPFEVIMVPGVEAVRARQDLLQRPGVTPVILGNDGDIALMMQGLSTDDGMVQAVLDEAHRIDLQAWAAQRRKEQPDLYKLPPGVWPAHVSAPRQLSVPLEVLTRKPKKNVMIAMFPTPRAWEVPAHVRYGGWNECPPAAVHVAMHQHWHERWGAQIACMSSDVIECTVERPPLTRPDAMALAREQMVYCPDIVHQGAQSLEGLAAVLYQARTWYFWWD